MNDGAYSSVYNSVYDILLLKYIGSKAHAIALHVVL